MPSNTQVTEGKIEKKDTSDRMMKKT
jgi:hypothetical protein